MTKQGQYYEAVYTGVYNHFTIYKSQRMDTEKAADHYGSSKPVFGTYSALYTRH